MEGGYKKLLVYQKAHVLAREVYGITKEYPKEELFGLTSQMRRCSVSVVANIVEGYGRGTKKEKVRFCCIARGSLTELEYFIDLSFDLGYLDEYTYNTLVTMRCDAGRLLGGYMKSLRR